MKALVLGGHGAVGRVVVDQLVAAGHEAVPSGRSPGRAGLRLDLAGPDGRRELAHVAPDFDAVVNASGLEDVGLAEAAGDTAFVEISATGRYLDELAHADLSSRTVVLGAGLVPGLSTLLVDELAPSAGDDVDLLVMLGSGEAHGTAAVEWTERLVGTDVHDPPEGRRVRNLRSAVRVAGPDGVRRHYLRADFPDHVLVGRRHGARVRSYLSMSSRLATAGLAAVARIPALAPAMARAPHLGSEDWHVVARNRRTGERREASGTGQSRATGIVVALAAEAVATSAPAGPVTTADVLSSGPVRAALG